MTADPSEFEKLAERSLKENGEGALVTIDAAELLDLLDVSAHPTDALYEAIPHVFRQRLSGRHEQDRLDAEVWWEKYAAVRKALTGDTK